MRLLRLLAALAVFSTLALPGRAEPDDDAPRLGMDEASLRQKLGDPTGVLAGGITRVLSYPEGTYTFKQGLLTKIEPRAAEAPPPGAGSLALAAMNQAPSRFRLETDAATEDQRALKKRAGQLLAAEDYTALENLASPAARDRTTFGDGCFRFYFLSFDFGCSPQDPPDAWQRQLHRLQAWMRLYPRSSAARLCYVCTVISYACAATAGGPAEAASPTVQSMIQARLKDAEPALEEARTLEPENPFYPTFALQLADNEHRPHAEMRSLFEQAKQRFPDVWTADTSILLYLLTPPAVDGEWEVLGDQETRRPGTIGVEGYARMAMFAARLNPGLYRQTHVRADLVMAGFRVLVGKYPDSRYYWSQFALHAFLASDNRQARDAFDHLKFAVHPDVFPSAEFADRVYQMVHLH